MPRSPNALGGNGVPDAMTNRSRRATTISNERSRRTMMDAETFDRWTASLTRLLTEAGSRRRALALGASGLAGLWHLGNAEETAAKRKHRRHRHNKGKKNPSPPPPPPDPCTNGVKDPGETDVDCGGTCGRCDIGKTCTVRNDCKSARCVGTCQACLDNSEPQCGLDTGGGACGCRTHESGQKFCTKINGTPFPAGTPCSTCQGGELCFPINGGANGIECIRPCGA
jgi:hypothetical protein